MEVKHGLAKKINIFVCLHMQALRPKVVSNLAGLKNRAKKDSYGHMKNADFFGVLHSSVYTFQKHIPVFRGFSFSKCKVVLSGYEGCHFFILFFDSNQSGLERD